MAIHDRVGAWRAMSLGVQSDIATALGSGFTLLNFEGDVTDPEVDKSWTNDAQITGTALPTRHQTLTFKHEFKHQDNLTPSLAGIIASMVMGVDTVSTLSGTARRHKIQFGLQKELKYRTMIENDGRAQKLFTGIAASGFTIEGERSEFCKISADFIGSTKEATNATAKPALINQSYLAYCDTTFTRGGTYDGSAVSGGTALAAVFRKFKLDVKNNATGVNLMGDATCGVGSIRRGPRPSAMLSAEFEVEDASHYDAMKAGTEFVIQIPILGSVIVDSHKYGVIITAPRARYKTAKKSFGEDGTLIVAADFVLLDDGTHGGLVVDVQDTHTANYLA